MIIFPCPCGDQEFHDVQGHHDRLVPWSHLETGEVNRRLATDLRSFFIILNHRIIDDGSSDVITSGVLDFNAQFMHHLINHCGFGDDSHGWSEPVVSQRVSPNKTEKVFQTMCPKVQKGPMIVCILNELYQNDRRIQDVRPIRIFSESDSLRTFGTKFL
jgi:hypothetical protein